MARKQALKIRCCVQLKLAIMPPQEQGVYLNSPRTTAPIYKQKTPINATEIIIPVGRVVRKDSKRAVRISIILIPHKMARDKTFGTIWLSICCCVSSDSINLLTPEYIQSSISNAITILLSISS